MNRNTLGLIVVGSGILFVVGQELLLSPVRRGFINRIKDLSEYTVERRLDGFVVEARAYLLKGSESYRACMDNRGGVANRRGCLA